MMIRILRLSKPIIKDVKIINLKTKDNKNAMFRMIITKEMAVEMKTGTYKDKDKDKDKGAINNNLKLINNVRNIDVEIVGRICYLEIHLLYFLSH